jgi:hypothetical protein
MPRIMLRFGLCVKTKNICNPESKPTEVLLVGLSRALPYFEEKADDDPDSMLLLVAKPRTQPIHKAAAARIKAKLMREAWRPEYFRSAHK